jgi:peptidoglycan/LPS O-acetylase OafA/YrhL
MERGRIETLDAWRGLLAVVVFFFHAGMFRRLTHMDGGPLAVDIFFMLSGFVLTHAYDERLRSGAINGVGFWLARVRRLMPLHVTVLATIVAYAAVMSLFGIPHYWSGAPALQFDVASIGWLAWDFGLFNSIVPTALDGERYWGLSLLTWSISVELWFGLILLVVLGRKGKWRFWFAGAVAIAAYLMAYGQLGDAGGGEGIPAPVLRGCGGFMAGFLTYYGFQRLSALTLSLSRRQWTILEMVAALATLLTMQQFIEPNLIVAPVGIALLLVFAMGRGALSDLLRNRAFQLLGAWSSLSTSGTGLCWT